MKRKIVLDFCILILTAGCFRFAYAGGYFKSFLTFEDDGSETDIVSRNTLRMEFSRKLSEPVYAEAAYSISPRVQDPGGFEKSENMLLGSYRIDDLNHLPYYGEGSFGAYQNLDRLFISIKFDKADIYAGRQAISWGSSKMVNPTNVIVPYNIDVLDKEESVGVDAFRARIPTGRLGEFDAGAVFGKDFEGEESAYFARNKSYFSGNDVSALYIWYKENSLIGFDLTRALGQVGFWIETGYTFGSDDNDYLRSTIGLDYNFSGDLYSYIEYHQNNAGAEKKEEYKNVLMTDAYAKGGIYLLGRNYIMPGVLYQLTPLASASANAIFNVNDSSIFLSPGIEYNIAQNSYVSLGAFLGIGARPEEFAEYPDIYHISYRYYF